MLGIKAKDRDKIYFLEFGEVHKHPGTHFYLARAHGAKAKDRDVFDLVEFGKVQKHPGTTF